MTATDAALALNVTNLVGLVILPMLTGLRVCYHYAGLPLHYLDSGWDLQRLGTSLCVALLVRSSCSNPLYVLAALGWWHPSPW